MVLASKIRTVGRLSGLVWVAVVMLSSPLRAWAETPSPVDLFPANALGYIHVDVDGLRETPTFRVLDQLVGHVRTEAAVLSNARLGIDLTTLADVTVVIPAFEVAVAANGNEPPLCAIANFTTSFRPNEFASKLRGNWQTADVDGNTLYVQGEKAVFVASNKTVVLGARSAVTWWLNSAREDQGGTLTQLLIDSLGEGQILLGVDARQLPAEFVNQLPEQYQGLARCEFASLDITLDDTIQLAGYLTYGNEFEANQARDHVQASVKQGLALLAFAEAELQRELTQTETSVDDAMGSLAGLAVLRQGAETLEGVSLSQVQSTVIMELGIDSDLLFSTVAGAAAIQAVGRHATPAEFQPVADQLQER